MSTTILTDAQKAEFVTDITGYGTGFVTPLFAVVDSIEQAVLQSPECARWADASKGGPHGEGQYVVRINRHGHIRLGQRVLNSDTLRHQWQVDGEICEAVTHYLPIPALTIKEKP